MTVSGVGYGTTSKGQSQNNDVDSTIKTYIDNWYKNNLSNYANKLSNDATFCNNRIISNNSDDSWNNLGYGINPTIYYGMENNSSNLDCLTNDSFSVSTTQGNGKLIYSIGLITMDEVNMAGGVKNSNNLIYYLYSGNNYWTMTPYSFDVWFYTANVYVSSTGSLQRAGARDIYGVRPVVNLDSDNLTFTGNGTMQDPYVIS